MLVFSRLIGPKSRKKKTQQGVVALARLFVNKFRHFLWQLMSNLRVFLCRENIWYVWKPKLCERSKEKKVVKGQFGIE